MMFALGAAASAIDGLFGLVSSKQTPSAGSGQDQANLFAFQADAATSTGTSAGPAAGGGAQISPETMSALLAAQSQSGTSFTPMSRGEALRDLFSQIDADGDGKISKSEFEDALSAGGTNLEKADSVFGKLDRDGDGSVTLGEMASALMRGRGRHREHDHVENGPGDNAKDPLLQALDGASSTSVTNADGSTTTSLTYADGSTVTMTRPASSSASATATSSYNFLEQLIQRQANAIAAQASSSLSVSV